MPFRLFKLVCCCFLLLISSVLNAGTVDTVMVKDLSDEYLVYDKSFKTYVPLNDQKVKSANIYHDLAPYENYSLVFTAKPGLSFFVNHELIYENVSSTEEKAFIPVKDIINLYPAKSLLTFYHDKKGIPDEVILAHQSVKVDNAGVSYNSRFTDSLFGNQYFYLFIFILLVFAFMRQRFPRKVQEIVFSRGEDNISLYDFFNSSSLLFIIINSLCFTYLIALFPFFDLISSNTPWNLFFLFLGIFISFYLKYFLLHIVSSIFGINSFSKIHFLEIIRLSTRVNIFLVPIATIIRFSAILNLEVSQTAFLIAVIAVLFIVLFKLILLTFRVSGFKNIYLFSYLCIAEVIPLGFALKITLLS